MGAVMAKGQPILVNFVCDYNSLVVYKGVDTKRYYCHYCDGNQDAGMVLYSASKYDGSKFEASCHLQSQIYLKLEKPLYAIYELVTNGFVHDIPERLEVCTKYYYKEGFSDRQDAFNELQNYKKCYEGREFQVIEITEVSPSE